MTKNLHNGHADTDNMLDKINVSKPYLQFTSSALHSLGDLVFGEI